MPLETPSSRVGVARDEDSDALARVADQRGCPKVITVDNGSEVFSKEMDSGAYKSGVKLDFIRPGKSVENAFIESLNGRLHDECLNAELVLSLDDARQKLLQWKLDYNRPHSSIGNLTPTEFAERCQEKMTA